MKASFSTFALLWIALANLHSNRHLSASIFPAGAPGRASVAREKGRHFR